MAKRETSRQPDAENAELIANQELFGGHQKEFQEAQNNLRQAQERVRREHRSIPQDLWNRVNELLNEQMPTVTEETAAGYQAAAIGIDLRIATMRGDTDALEQVLNAPAPTQPRRSDQARERGRQTAPEQQPAGERIGQPAAETEQLPQEIRSQAQGTLRELGGILKQDIEKAPKSALDEYKETVEAAKTILRQAGAAGIETDKVFNDLSKKIKTVEGWLRAREENFLTDEIYDEQRELDKISAEIEQLTTEETIKEFSSDKLNQKLEPAEELLRDLREHSGLRRERARLQSKVDSIRAQHLKKTMGMGGGAEITSREQQKAERDMDSAIASIRKLIGKLQAGTIGHDTALPAGVQEIIDANRDKVGRGKWLDLQETQNDLEEAREARRQSAPKEEALKELRAAQTKLNSLLSQLESAKTLDEVGLVKKAYEHEINDSNGLAKQANDYVNDKGLSDKREIKPEHHQLTETIDALKDALEKKKIVVAVREAQDKLQLAHQWLDGFEQEVNVPTPLTKEQVAELNRKYHETEREQKNQVKQAKDYVKKENLSTNDEVKPENNRMEERLRKLKEAIEKHEQELHKKNVNEALAQGSTFLEAIKQRGAALDEKYGTIAKREAEWGILKSQLDAVHREALANPQVAKDYREQLDKLRGLIDEDIPEALAGAAINVPREHAEKFMQDWGAVKTLEDFLAKIKEYKEKTEGGEVVLSPKEIVDDEKIDEWLRQRFTADIVGDLKAALDYAKNNKLPDGKGGMVLIAKRPDFKANVENLKLAGDKLEKFLKEKNKVIIEDKHRVRTMPAATSAEVQKGKAKAEILYDDASLEKVLDREKVAQMQIVSKIIDTIMRKHGWFGKEKDEEGANLRVRDSEEAVIRDIEQALGPGTQFGFRTGANGQCRDLFYAAKSYIWERATSDIEHGPREEMRAVPIKGGYETDKPGTPEVPGTTTEQPQMAKGGRFRRIIKRLGYGAAQAGASGGIIYGMSTLGPLGALAGVGITGALRITDDLTRSVLQRGKINQWKEKMRGDEKFMNGLKDHLAFHIVTLKENQLRSSRGSAPDYETYFNNSKTHLNGINSEREVPLSEAEINKVAAAYATFYALDNQIETDRTTHQVSQSPNTRRWWNIIDRTLGVSLRDRPGQWGWKLSSGRDKFYAGSASLGIGMGLFAARSFLQGVPLVGSAARRLAHAYAGWKYGGAIADMLVGKKSPEESTQRQLATLQAEADRLEQTPLPWPGGIVRQLQECWATLEQVHNPVEYSRQKERLKEITMKVYADKILKEEEVQQLRTEDELRRLGGTIFSESLTDYEGSRDGQVREQARGERQRLWGRILGAVTMGALGYAGEQLIEYLMSRKAAAAPERVWGDKGWQDAGAARGGAGSGGLPGTRLPGGPSRVEGIPAMAVVRHHEGVEHALGRQIEAQAEEFGYNAGMGDKHSWAMAEAHRVALSNDYFDDGGASGGAETRVGPEDRVAYFFKYGADGKPVLGASGKPIVHEVVGRFGPTGAFLEDAGTRKSGPDAPVPEWYEYRYPGAGAHSAGNIDTTPMSTSSQTGAGEGGMHPTGGEIGDIPHGGQQTQSLVEAAGPGATAPETATAQSSEMQSLHDLIISGKATPEQKGLMQQIMNYQATEQPFAHAHDNAEQYIKGYINHHPGDVNKYPELKTAAEQMGLASGGPASSHVGVEAATVGQDSGASHIPNPELNVSPASAVEAKLNRLLPMVSDNEHVREFIREPFGNYHKGQQLTGDEIKNLTPEKLGEYLRFRTHDTLDDYLKDSSPENFAKLRHRVVESEFVKEWGQDNWQEVKNAFSGKYQGTLESLQELTRKASQGAGK